MEEQKIVPCIFCGCEAHLKTDGMTIKKGLVKVNITANNYACGSCKRTFRTNAQDLDTSASILPHKPKMHLEKDHGGVGGNKVIFQSAEQKKDVAGK